MNGKLIGGPYDGKLCPDEASETYLLVDRGPLPTGRRSAATYRRRDDGAYYFVGLSAVYGNPMLGGSLLDPRPDQP